MMKNREYVVLVPLLKWCRLIFFMRILIVLMYF